MNLRNFVGELKRRNVYKVAIAYAVVLTMVGENSRAISTLTRLLEMPYGSAIYGPGAITSALLRLDPTWDPLRGDPVFQKLCEEKRP